MKTGSRGDIQIPVGMVDPVEPPQNRETMVGDVPQIRREIKIKQGEENVPAGADRKNVKQADLSGRKKGCIQDHGAAEEGSDQKGIRTGNQEVDCVMAEDRIDPLSKRREVFNRHEQKKTAEPGKPIPLFATHIGGAIQGNDTQEYFVSPDGQRFLMNAMVNDSTSPITLILNWKPPAK